jgi:hypothetical protein
VEQVPNPTGVDPITGSEQKEANKTEQNTKQK